MNPGKSALAVVCSACLTNAQPFFYQANNSDLLLVSLFITRLRTFIDGDSLPSIDI